MLVLTRKSGEWIVIGGSITVKVLETQGNQVRIGIQAPPGVKILRQELVRGQVGAAAPGEENHCQGKRRGASKRLAGGPASGPAQPRP